MIHFKIPFPPLPSSSHSIPLWFLLNLLVVMWMLKYTVNITKRRRYQNFILAVIPIKNTINWKKQTKTVLLCKNSTEITGYLHFLKKIQYNQRIRESKHLIEFIEEQSFILFTMADPAWVCKHPQKFTHIGKSLRSGV